MTLIQCKNGHSFDAEKGIYCPVCGEKASVTTTQSQKVPDKRICPECGKTVPLKAMFCRHCGVDLSKQAIPAKEAEKPDITYTEIVCPACGAILPGASVFCDRCGSSIPEFLRTITNDNISLTPSAQAVTDDRQQQTVFGEPKTLTEPDSSEEPLQTVELNKNGETVTFYKDRLSHKDFSISYDKIALMSIAGYVTKSRGISSYAIFNGELKLVMYDKSTYKIRIGGFSVFGAGSAKDGQARYILLLDAVYNYLAKGMAAVLLEQINNGNTVDVTGVTISRDKAIFRKGIRRTEIIVNEQNFGQCRLQKGVKILDKSGNIIASFDSSWPNALILPYLLNTLFDKG